MMNEKILCFLGAAICIGFIKFYNTIFNKKKLGYKEYIISKKGRTAELMNASICLLIWLAIFSYDLLTSSQNNFLFSFILGCMSGITIGTIYTLQFMPKGFYEKGVLTETKAFSYKTINRVEITDAKKGTINKLAFYLKNGKTVYLYITKDEIKKIKLLIKEHRL